MISIIIVPKFPSAGGLVVTLPSSWKCVQSHMLDMKLACLVFNQVTEEVFTEYGFYFATVAHNMITARIIFIIYNKLSILFLIGKVYLFDVKVCS